MSADPVTQLADWEGVREALAEIRAGREDFGRFFAEMFSEMEAMLADARNELVQAREEFRRQREELEAAQAQTRHDILEQQSQLERARAESDQTQPDNELSEKLSHAEQECRALMEERAVLESELETVRTRAAEMAESLDEQKKRTAQQQARWEDEFHWQRRLLEEVAGRLADHALGSGDMPVQSQQEAEPPGPPESVKLHTSPQPRPAETPDVADDGVLDSVMAQFQMLQKDVAQRRRKSQAG